MKQRLLALVRPRRRRTGDPSRLTAFAEVAFTAIAHPRRRPWDEDDRRGSNIPHPRAARE